MMTKLSKQQLPLPLSISDIDGLQAILDSNSANVTRTIYDISNQADGVKTTFAISTDITNEDFNVYYNGVLQRKNIDYTINITQHTISLLLTDKISLGESLIIECFS
ncbi:MAG: hypothetical protein LBF97_06570 [Elusimicrobiota bacterium]|jgi:hypothetical protein|nr:hypothetical protein [Elusimicrobiota bacterium]